MQIIQGKWKIPHAARKPLVFFLVFLFLSIQFRFLFTDRVPDSVSLQNQYLIAQDYQILFKNFLSSGYDRSLQGGSPTFYFQAPFFFFLVSFIHTFILFFLPFGTAFNLGILLALFLFSYAFLKLGFLFLTETGLSPGNALLTMTGLMFYFLYPGDRLVGAGIVGIFQNSISSSVGLAFALLAIYYLEKFRYTGKVSSFSKNLITGTLVFYTHYETSLFYVIALSIYFLFYKDEFAILEILSIFLLPFLCASPILWNHFVYVPYQQNPPVSFPINGLLSLLGEEFSNSVSRPEKFLDVLKQILIDQYWIHLLFPILFVIGIRLLFIRKLLPPISRFLIFGTLFFYWMATDSSLSLILPWLHVQWYTALNVSLVFLTFSALVTARFFLKNLPPGKWKLWAGLILFVLGLYRFIVTIPGPSTGIESLSGNPSSVWKQKEIWIRVFEKTSYGSLIASEDVAGEGGSGDSRWASVLIRQAVRRNITLTNRFENSFPASAEEILRLFPVQGPKQVGQKNVNPPVVREKEKLSELFLNLLSERGVSYVLLKSDALNRIVAASPKSFSQIDKKGEWTFWKLNSSRPFMELLTRKPIALLIDESSFRKKSGFGLENLPESILDLKFQWNVSWVPVFKEEFESNKADFSGVYEVSQLHSYFQKRAEEEAEREAERKPTIKREKKESTPFFPEIEPLSWNDSEIQWELSKEKKPDVCFPILLRSGFFPLWKLISGENVYRTSEGQFYFCSKERKNQFVFYDIRTYLITLVQLLLPLSFFGAAFLTRRKISN
ncbi:membrane protein [Leptospira alstonii]|uniref:Membrane protein n=2 Tax=Leptospira alstonii TaxID=28452 RepID=T0FRE8_9LEPT|nr:membrane protein [Leptospira alstonii]EMJ97802.1 putative membrane protein [Leptospira alstonii serovar Sichuan str. 79601]EQA80280.1 putative membrane protein [Leptospira alstonii serovar Pingchang str. 80-412]